MFSIIKTCCLVSLAPPGVDSPSCEDVGVETWRKRLLWGQTHKLRRLFGARACLFLMISWTCCSKNKGICLVKSFMQSFGGFLGSCYPAPSSQTKTVLDHWNLQKQPKRQSSQKVVGALGLRNSWKNQSLRKLPYLPEAEK